MQTPYKFIEKTYETSHDLIITTTQSLNRVYTRATECERVTTVYL